MTKRVGSSSGHKERFLRDPTINPRTGRKITTCCKAYHSLVVSYGFPDGFEQDTKNLPTRTDVVAGSKQEKFLTHPTVNPDTNRKITHGGEAYRKLVLKYGIPFADRKSSSRKSSDRKSSPKKSPRKLSPTKIITMPVLAEKKPTVTGGSGGKKKRTKKSNSPTKLSPTKILPLPVLEPVEVKPRKTRKTKVEQLSPTKIVPLPKLVEVSPRKATKAKTRAPRTTKTKPKKSTKPKSPKKTTPKKTTPKKASPINKKLGSGTYSTVERRQLPSGELVAVKHVEPSDNGVSKHSMREIHCLTLMKGSKYFLNLMDIDIQVKDDITYVDLTLTLHTSNLDTFSRTVSSADRIRFYPSIKTQLLRGLYHMYVRGLLHRDIKPQNILVQYNPEQLTAVSCYYADFGLSRQLACNTKERQIMMTIPMYSANYRAPEIALNDANYTENADVWALGLTLLDYLTKDITIASYAVGAKENKELIETILDAADSDYSVKKYTLKVNNSPSNDLYIKVDKILQDKLNAFARQGLTEKDVWELEQMLYLNPNKRVRVETMVTKEVFGPPTVHMPSRGPPFEGDVGENELYYQLVFFMMDMAYALEFSVRTIIGAIDLLERYLAHFKIEKRDRKLIAITCLEIVSKMIEQGPAFLEASANIVEETVLKTIETEIKIMKSMNYLFISCDIDPFIHYIDENASTYQNKYDKLAAVYISLRNQGLYPGALTYPQIISNYEA
jgi:hypothetical protein